MCFHDGWTYWNNLASDLVLIRAIFTDDSAGGVPGESCRVSGANGGCSRLLFEHRWALRSDELLRLAGFFRKASWTPKAAIP